MFKFTRYTSTFCGVEPSDIGRLVYVADVIKFLHWLEDNDDPKVMLAKITLTLEDLA